MASIAVPQPKDDTKFRTCPVTALKVDLAAEKLIIANAVTAVVFLAIGGLFALLLASPAGKLFIYCPQTGFTAFLLPTALICWFAGLFFLKSQAFTLAAQ